MRLIAIISTLLILINFWGFSKLTKEEYLIVHLANGVESSGSEEYCEAEDPGAAHDEPIFSMGEDGFVQKFVITEDFTVINNHDDKLEFKYSEYKISYPLSAVQSIGFMIEEKSEIPVEEIELEPLINGWRIYTLDGTLVRSSDSGEPSFTLLESGKVYIIIDKNKKYKYHRWK